MARWWPGLVDGRHFVDDARLVVVDVVFWTELELIQ